MVLQSARTLADLTEQRVIPADYLYCLILLFLCLVLDRVFYTLGHHLGKVLLVLAELPNKQSLNCFRANACLPLVTQGAIV